IAVVQKSPIFCSLVPLAVFAFAAFSLISLNRFKFSSITRFPMPQLLKSPGMGFLFIQPPLAYSKKSWPGAVVVSRLSAKKSFLAVDAFSGLLQEVQAVIAATDNISNVTNRIESFYSAKNK